MTTTAWISAIAAIFVAYLLGSIPFGLLIGRMRGIDIRQVGSCNIGATNVMRSVGKGWGILTLLLDALKGYIPAAAFPLLLMQAGLLDDQHAWLKIACGCAAILGHNFPVFLRFKGGKGVATSAGVLLGIAPLALLIGLGAFAVVFATSRFVSVGSITAAIIVPLAGFWLYEGRLIPIVLTVLGLLVIWRHKANIRRLLNGTENRIVFGKKSKVEIIDRRLKTEDSTSNAQQIPTDSQTKAQGRVTGEALFWRDGFHAVRSVVSHKPPPSPLPLTVPPPPAQGGRCARNAPG